MASTYRRRGILVLHCDAVCWVLCWCVCSLPVYVYGMGLPGARLLPSQHLWDQIFALFCFWEKTDVLPANSLPVCPAGFLVAHGLACVFVSVWHKLHVAASSSTPSWKNKRTFVVSLHYFFSKCNCTAIHLATNGSYLYSTVYSYPL